MVVHSPKTLTPRPSIEADAIEVDTGAVGGAVVAAAGGAGIDPAVGGTAAAAAAPGRNVVPPSVLAASQAVETADLLGGAQGGLDAWNGDVPPARTQAVVHPPAKEEQKVIKQDNVLPQAGGVAPDNVTPDLGGLNLGGGAPPQDGLPGLNPFTPEWFAQIIGAAATAAATAVASSSRTPPPVVNPAAPRRLNDRKVPDFWEDKPDFWFRIFDAHLSYFRPSEQRCFDALLPLLTPAARATVHSIIRTPGISPYSKAREVLLRHFGKTPRQLAREYRDTRSLSDRLPSEHLDHLMALLPDVRAMHEVYLLDALPDNARVAALQHTDLRAMALAADAVVLESRASSEHSAVNSVSILDSELDGACSSPPLTPSVAAVGRDSRPAAKKSDSVCSNHKRWGKETFKCLAPSSCKMRGVICPRPPPSQQSPASGNGKAGGRQ